MISGREIVITLAAEFIEETDTAVPLLLLEDEPLFSPQLSHGFHKSKLDSLQLSLRE
jgi:hypothetical protein